MFILKKINNNPLLLTSYKLLAQRFLKRRLACPKYKDYNYLDVQCVMLSILQSVVLIGVILVQVASKSWKRQSLLMEPHPLAVSQFPEAWMDAYRYSVIILNTSSSTMLIILLRYCLICTDQLGFSSQRSTTCDILQTLALA